MQTISRLARYIGRFTAYAVGSTLPAYRLARGWREKASVVRLVLKFTAKRAVVVLMRLAHNTMLQDDVPIMVRGVTYFMGIDAAETPVFGEIYDDRDYDRLPDFIPREGWIVLDVGANAGIFAVQQANRGARVYAFEPNPHSYRRLTKTAAANGLDGQITSVNSAVGAEAGRGALVVPHGWTSNGMVVSGAGPAEAGAVSVPVDTLDHLVSTLALDHVDLLKIDTEGAELDVLRGGERALTTVARIVLEYHSWDKLTDVRALLQAHGFAEALHLELDPHAGTGILYARRTAS